MSRLRSWTASLLLLLGSALASLLACELGLRVYQRLTLGAPLGNEGLYASARPEDQARLPNLFDRRLGWRPAEGYVFDGAGHREDGSSYPLHVTQGPHGSRRWGAGQGPRTLVLGDSYTQALEASDDRTYYVLLEREVGLRVYAVGSSGYGTLQEALLLEEVWDEVRPELVIWQFCYNDFMNNSYELESEWTAGNCDLHERPYLDGEEIRFRLPGPAERFRTWAQHSTRLYEFLAGRWARLVHRQRTDQDVLLQEILTQGARHPGFRRSIGITDRLLGRVDARVGATPVVLWEACTTAAPFHPAIEDLARRHRMRFVPELPAALDVAEQGGQKLLADDHVHWNEEGQRIIANALAPHVRQALQRRQAIDR